MEYLVDVILILLVLIATLYAIYSFLNPKSTLLEGISKLLNIETAEAGVDKEKEQTLRQEAFDSVTNLFEECKSKKKDLCVCTGKDKIFIPNAYFLFSQPAEGLRVELVGEQGTLSTIVKDASLCYARNKNDISDINKISTREKRVYMTDGRFYVEGEPVAKFIPPAAEEGLFQERVEREFLNNPFAIVKNMIASKTYLCLLPSDAVKGFEGC